MGPELLVGSALLGGGSTILGGISSFITGNAQADADRQKADIESKWAERQALDVRAAAQRGAQQNLKQATLAGSRLNALAGSSGSGVDDPTVVGLAGDIDKEGRLNSENTLASGEQKATGINYQADLNKWTTDANASIKESAATSTLIGGLLSGGSQIAGMGRGYGAMAGRYGQPSYQSNYRYG